MAVPKPKSHEATPPASAPEAVAPATTPPQVRIGILDHRQSPMLKDIVFQYGNSHPVAADDERLAYFRERPSEYVIYPAECNTFTPPV